MVNTTRDTTAKGEVQASAPKTTCKRRHQQQGAKTCRERRRPGTCSKALRHNANVGMRSKLRRYVAPTLSPRARRESSHHTYHGAHSHTQINCLTPCTRQPFAQRLYWLSTLSSVSLFSSHHALSRCRSTRSNLPGTSASQVSPDGRRPILLEESSTCQASRLDKETLASRLPRCCTRLDTDSPTSWCSTSAHCEKLT